MEYPLKEFLKERATSRANRKSITYCRELLRDEGLIHAELRKLFDLPARWLPGKDEPRRPADYSSKGSGKNETKFQRDIYALDGSVLGEVDTGAVRWIDLEVPVDYHYGQARRACPDLVGYGKDGKTYLVDLKYTRLVGAKYSATDTPAVGAYKSLYYAHCALTNAENLREYRIFHTNSKIDSVDLNRIYAVPVAVLAANKDYWDFWEKSLGGASAVSNLIRTIKKHSRIEFKAYQCASSSTPWTEKS